MCRGRGNKSLRKKEKKKTARVRGSVGSRGDGRALARKKGENGPFFTKKKGVLSKKNDPHHVRLVRVHAPGEGCKGPASTDLKRGEDELSEGKKKDRETGGKKTNL